MATVDVDIKKLLEAGAHFGHKTSRWHPKMAPFIHSKRNGSHIIDLTKTVEGLNVALDFLSQTAAEGKQVLFVGTKRQIQDIVKTSAEEAKMPFVTERWLGGMLTNWPTISGRVKHLKDLETKMESGELANRFNKLEVQRFQEEIDEMNRIYGGIKNMAQRVGAVFIQDQVTDALWPDTEGDAADQALRTTLHRLRKLLQEDRAVRLEDRHLSLDARYLWADCLAFDRAAHHPQLADRGTLQRTLNRYRGAFLQGESAPWAVAFRERLRAQYMRMAERLGSQLEREGDGSAAIDCYLRAIEVEPLAEALYRHLMNTYARLERRSEALAVYQRCRQSLLSRLGVSPAPETQALYRRLVDA